MAHPYSDFVRRFSALLEDARRLPLGGLASVAPPPPPADAPRALIFAPHPDDECIIGGLALRLQRELRWRVKVAAVTTGSRADRRAPRLQEMRGACGFLGWELITTQEGGLTGVKPETRGADPKKWAQSVSALARVLNEEKPRLIFIPHARDANSTHQGTHHLITDALKSQGSSFQCLVAETEYWGTLEAPNLLIESSPSETADLVAALSFHAGEVARNPYHALLPCWMADAVRRGGELVGGQGEAAPAFPFATLYRLSRWNGTELKASPPRVIASGADLASLFR